MLMLESRMLDSVVIYINPENYWTSLCFINILIDLSKLPKSWPSIHCNLIYGMYFPHYFQQLSWEMWRKEAPPGSMNFQEFTSGGRHSKLTLIDSMEHWLTGECDKANYFPHLSKNCFTQFAQSARCDEKRKIKSNWNWGLILTSVDIKNTYFSVNADSVSRSGPQMKGSQGFFQELSHCLPSKESW